MRNTYRIGTGAGFSSDRLEPALDLLRHGKLDAIIFECVGERTLAFGHRDRRADPDKGYNPLLERRMRAVLPLAHAAGTRIITNMGVANPRAAALHTVKIAAELGLTGLKVAAVTGDEVNHLIGPDTHLLEPDCRLSETGREMLAANAYLGIEAILPAIEAGADVIITGRVADPSLILAPLVHEFGWALSDWHLLGAGTAVGHLLECAAQVTGGFFADPGYKDVPDLVNIGFPIAEVRKDGTCVISKPAGSGGEVSVRTCKEQLFYEIQDPAAYLTPDVTADFSKITLSQTGVDEVRVKNATGKKRPDALKVALGVRDGFIGEGEISYGGSGALDRARLAEKIIIERLRKENISGRQIKTECIGFNSLLGPVAERVAPPPFEVRLRVAAKVDSEKEARRVGDEVEALYLNGPAGPAGARKYVRPVIAVYSTTIARDLIETGIHVKEVG